MCSPSVPQQCLTVPQIQVGCLQHGPPLGTGSLCSTATQAAWSAPHCHLPGWQFSCATVVANLQVLCIFQGELKLKKLLWFLVMVKSFQGDAQQDRTERAGLLGQDVNPGQSSIRAQALTALYTAFVQSTIAWDSSSYSHAKQQPSYTSSRGIKSLNSAAMQTLPPYYMLAMPSGSTGILKVPRVSLTSSLCPASIFLCSKAFRLICTAVASSHDFSSSSTDVLDFHVEPLLLTNEEQY